MQTNSTEQADWYVENIKPFEADLRRWLGRRFALGSAVDDILQESYLRAIKARDRGVLHSPRAFLFKASRNLAIDYLKKKSNSTEPLAKCQESSVIAFEDPIPEIVSRKNECQILKLAIESLPEKCREIFTMRKLYGMSQIEISEALGISRNTVSAQLTIGLRKCVNYFDNYEKDGGGLDD